jgi:disulfide bond formation protein DsbB
MIDVKRPDKFTVQLIWLITFLILSTVIASEYFLKLAPCELCIAQRIPYYIILLLSSTSLILKSEPIIQRKVVFFSATLFLITSIIGIIHVGTEQGIWDTKCSLSGFQSFSIEDIQEAILKPGTPACNDISFQLFGITMAGYNILLGLILFGLSIAATCKHQLWVIK